VCLSNGRQSIVDSRYYVIIMCDIIVNINVAVLIIIPYIVKQLTSHCYVALWAPVFLSHLTSSWYINNILLRSTDCIHITAAKRELVMETTNNMSTDWSVSAVIAVINCVNASLHGGLSMKSCRVCLVRYLLQ